MENFLTVWVWYSEKCLDSFLHMTHAPLGQRTKVKTSHNPTPNSAKKIIIVKTQKLLSTTRLLILPFPTGKKFFVVRKGSTIQHIGNIYCRSHRCACSNELVFLNLQSIFLLATDCRAFSWYHSDSTSQQSLNQVTHTLARGTGAHSGIWRKGLLFVSNGCLLQRAGSTLREVCKACFVIFIIISILQMIEKWKLYLKCVITNGEVAEMSQFAQVANGVL